MSRFARLEPEETMRRRIGMEWSGSHVRMEPIVVNAGMIAAVVRAIAAGLGIMLPYTWSRIRRTVQCRKCCLHSGDRRTSPCRYER